MTRGWRRLARIGVPLAAAGLAGCVPPTLGRSLENDVWAAQARVPRPAPVLPNDPRMLAFDKAVAAAERAAALRWIPIGTPEPAALHILAGQHFVFIVGKPGEPWMELEEARCLPWDCRGLRIALTIAQGRVADLRAEPQRMDYDF